MILQWGVNFEHQEYVLWSRGYGVWREQRLAVLRWHSPDGRRCTCSASALFHSQRAGHPVVALKTVSDGGSIGIKNAVFTLSCWMVQLRCVTTARTRRSEDILRVGAKVSVKCTFSTWLKPCATSSTFHRRGLSFLSRLILNTQREPLSWFLEVNQSLYRYCFGDASQSPPWSREATWRD